MKLSQMKEYRAWIDMRRRCNDPRRPQYRLYGARGIKVHPAWEKSFADFIAHVGYAPSAEFILDRIDNDGDYVPGNVRWSSPKDSSNNTRKTRHVIIEGREVTVSEASKRLKCSASALRQRLSRGMSMEEAATKPISPRDRQIEAFGKTQSAKQWSAECGVPLSTLNYRLRTGVPVEDALKPKQTKGNSKCKT